MSELDTTDQIKVLMIDDDELIARSTAKYFNFEKPRGRTSWFFLNV